MDPAQPGFTTRHQSFRRSLVDALYQLMRTFHRKNISCTNNR